jgi:UDP-glucose 4-epimerase
MTRPLDATSSALVTGGAGFVGSHLVETLVSRGVRTTVIDDLSNGSRRNLDVVEADIELIVGDVIEELRRGGIRPSEYDFVFNLAANAYVPTSVAEPRRDLEANLLGTFALLESLRESPSRSVFMGFSSAAVYGNPPRLPITEDDPTIPISPYGVSKLAAERYVSVYSSVFGIRGMSLRLFSVYGPRQRKQVVFDLLAKLRRSPEALELVGDGSQVRDLSYVSDVVSAIVTLATKAPAGGEVFNVAAGKSFRIDDLAQALCRVCGAKPTITHTGALRPGDAQEWTVDTSRLRDLGFAPQVALEDGLRAVRDWYDAGC